VIKIKLPEVEIPFVAILAGSLLKISPHPLVPDILAEKIYRQKVTDSFRY